MIPLWWRVARFLPGIIGATLVTAVVMINDLLTVVDE